MIKKLFVALSLLAAPTWAATVNQSGSVTAGHVPYWVTNGAIGDGGTSADSPITSLGVTNNGGSGVCVNSARITASGYNALCLGASTTGAATISLQNYGTAAAQALQFVINGTTYAFPGSLTNITIGTTPVIGGVNADCLVVSAGVVGQQPCNVSAVTSLTGDVSGTGPGVTVTTLATVNANVGTFGNGTTVPSITVNGKGLITAVSTSPVSVTVGTSVITSGSNNGLLYNNGGVLGNLPTLASAVLSTSVGGVPSLSATLPSGLTIPTPTFTGTLTFPDAATWTNVGVSKMAALSTGSATIPAGGNINVSGQYQVNGSQIAASNLSNGTTGSGNIVLATSPTIAGTWAGSVTFSGANTYSGNSTFSAQAIYTGTSAPASAAGNTVVMGTIAAPTLTNTGQAFLYNTVANGAVLEGDGSSFDVVIANKAGTAAMQLTTNTTVPVWPGLANGTCSAGLALDASNNMVKTSCPGAASSVQVGTTAVNSSTTGDCLYASSGILANQPCAIQYGGRLTAVSGTPVPAGTTNVTGNTKTIVITSGTTTVIPADFTSVNTIEVIGGGGGGGNSTAGNGSTSGGGGAYSKSSNIALTPGATVTIAVGAGGTPTNAGGDTYICNTNVTNCASIAGSAVQVGAKGGGAGVTGGTAAVSGGAAGSGVGTTKSSGGNSGTATGGNTCSSGAGGAAGPNGAGGNGGNCSGSTGGTGGTGDNGFVIAAVANTAGGTVAAWALSAGGTVTVGGGAGGASAGGGFAGGNYGAGASGGSNGAGGGTGAQGVIVITYQSSTAQTLWYAPCAGLVPGCSGPYLPIYNGTNITLNQFTSSNTDTTGLALQLNTAVQTTGNIYTIFGVNDTGTLRLCTGPAWTNSAAGTSSPGSGAGTAQLQMFLGLTTNAVSMTCSYASSTVAVAANQGTALGLMYATGNGQAYYQLYPPALAGGDNTVLGLCNMQNRMPIVAYSEDATASWTYASSTVHPANGSASNKIQFLDCLGSVYWTGSYVSSASPTGASATALTNGICVNTSGCTGFSDVGGAGASLGQFAANATATGGQVIGLVSPAPVIGYNTIIAGEQTTSNSMTMLGNDFMQLKLQHVN